MKKIVISIILVILLLILSGCGYGEYIGNVTDKKYTPARTTIMTTYTGKSFHTYPIYHTELWQIKIQKEEDGEIRTTWVTIPKEEYEKISIGDYWERGRQ